MLFERELPELFAGLGLVYVFLKGCAGKEKSLWGVFRQECHRKFYPMKNCSPTQLFVSHALVWYNIVFIKQSES